jgi:hypothetical protein
MAPNILRNKRAHRVTSRPSSFGETSIGAGRLARRTTRPGCRQGHRCDVGGAERANRRHPRGSAGLDYLGPVGGRHCYLDRQGCDRRVLAQAYRSDGKSGIRHRGEVSVAGWRRRSFQIPFGWRYLVTSRPTAPLRPSADGRTHGIDQLRGQLARPEIFRRVRCPSLRCGWLLFKMMHRSVGR